MDISKDKRKKSKGTQVEDVEARENIPSSVNNAHFHGATTYTTIEIPPSLSDINVIAPMTVIPSISISRESAASTRREPQPAQELEHIQRSWCSWFFNLFGFLGDDKWFTDHYGLVKLEEEPMH